MVRDEMALNATRGAAARRSRKKRRSQAPSETPQGTYRDSNGTDTGQATWLRWEELLWGSNEGQSTQPRVDPHHIPHKVGWKQEDIPEIADGTDIFPPIRSNIMELVCRHQQQQWAGKGIYMESVLPSLIITRHFGPPYPAYQISHQYGLTYWYKMLLYCVYCNCHWTLVTIFVTAEHYIALRVDPLLEKMDAFTMNIIQHLH